MENEHRGAAKPKYSPKCCRCFRSFNVKGLDLTFIRYFIYTTVVEFYDAEIITSVYSVT